MPRDTPLLQEREYQINAATYQWSVRVFSTMRRMLGVNVKLHDAADRLAEGEIFVFNHFARFETFIPQYLIYLETGAYCRSVAAHELLAADDALSRYLVSVGAVPNNHPRLFPLLAAEILRGRKVIVFPEGGMVKDRRVLDAKGGYSVYSRVADARRKHHTGAAVLATALAAYKRAVLRALAAGEERRLEQWSARLGLSDVETLLAAARRPTVIVPANITFYPIRVDDNLLSKGMELISRGISRRLSEELLIESNILLRHTDMDIRLGAPVRPDRLWRWWDRALLRRVVRRLETLDGFFTLRRPEGRWDERLLARSMRRSVQRIRDHYMHRIYAGTTVNLSHLAATLIMRLLDGGHIEIESQVFRRMLYLSVKYVQREGSLFLHRSLRNPEAYAGLPDGTCAGHEQFIDTASSLGLLDQNEARYRFLPRLREESEFDRIRMENPVAVYANEVAPLPAVAQCVARALDEGTRPAAQALAALRFDDERVALAWDRRQFSKPRHARINMLETATESAEPFLLRPAGAGAPAVLLVHGFLASPAEVRGLGERLAAAGHAVLGVRLKGHGTSPWDLRERSWQDWLASVRRGYVILSAYADSVCLAGFSTGGALCLRLAAEQPAGLAGVAAVSVPLRFRNRNLIFVPLVHGANRLVHRFSSIEGIMPFRPNESEHPHINYRNIPIRALYELRRLAEEVERRLPEVHCPVALLQGDADPVVDPASAAIVRDGLGSREKTLRLIPAARHGILYEDLGGTQQAVLDFVARLAAAGG